MNSKELKDNTQWFQATSNGAPDLLPSEQSGHNLDALIEDTTEQDRCFACDKVVKVWQKTIPTNRSEWINACITCYDRAFNIRYSGYINSAKRYTNSTIASKEDTRVFRDYWAWSLALVKDQLAEEASKLSFQKQARELLIKASHEQSYKELVEPTPAVVVKAVEVKPKEPTTELTTCYCCSGVCRKWDFIWTKDHERITPTFMVCPKCYTAVYKLRHPSVILGSFNECVGSGLEEDWKPYLDKLKGKQKQSLSDLSASVYQSDYKALRSLEDAVARLLIHHRILSPHGKSYNAELEEAFKVVRQKHVESIMCKLPNIIRTCHHEQCLQEVCFHQLQ